MYDGTAILKAYETTGRDAQGNPIRKETKSTVYVQPRGVYASEYYTAAQLGLKPSLSLYMASREDYHGEKVVEYEGRDYSVIRVDWTAQRDGITLVCEEKSNNG